jgi:dephospho-CoA kinase
MMREIGLTGGIGSGKTTVARAFQALGYRVYYADDRAKALYDEDADLRTAMIALLGTEIYDVDGKLVRSRLAELIFGNKALLAKVNALVHPAVASDYKRWLQHCPDDYTKGAVIKEAAILFEAGSNTASHGVIMVYAPKQVRLARVQSRDGAVPAQVLARMNHQWPDSTKLALSDFVIYNDGTHTLLPQVQRSIQWMETL